jgi:Asp-tRNA(Asn)/Glu-tRNA(Gln) amidotransferase A subunit family amidase
LLSACLDAIEAREGVVRAFAWIDAARARRLARAADERRASGKALGVLDGIPVGVKDIVDTAGIPTEHGSAMFAGRVPAASASLVVALERAGAIVLGKTVTTEVAFFHPGPTTNPWNPERTPGGSSMGSAAGVAAGMVLGAVGTQTNGSVIRPAAFCGVVGYKPSAGRIPKDGVLTFSRTLDQVGSFARSVEGAAWLAAAMVGESPAAWLSNAEAAADSAAAGRPLSGLRIAAVRTAEWEHAAQPMRDRFEADVAALAAAGAGVEWPALPGRLDASPPVHRTIMAYEGAAALGGVAAAHPQQVSATLRAFLAEGERISADAYSAALAERERLIRDFGAWAAQFAAVVTPPACGEAPGPETTGDPRFCTRWTLVGAPALTLPTGRGPAGLPLGLQVVGAPGADTRTLVAARRIERALGASAGRR